MMKRTILAMAVLAASVAVADDVTSSNVLGLLPVTSSAKRTIVSVPWCAMSATDNSAIQVSNVVKTANLTVNDTLHFVNSSGKYYTWKLAEDTSTNVRYWESVNEATAQQVANTPSSAGTTVARGNAIVLIRQNPVVDNVAQTFYLYGQVATNSSVSSTIEKGSAESPAYTLIASPSTSAWTVNGSDHTWSNVGSNDNLYVYDSNGMTIQLVWQDNSWGSMNDVWTDLGGERVRSGKTFSAYTAEIPAGIGVWYVSNGGEGTPCVTWNAVPSK